MTCGATDINMLNNPSSVDQSTEGHEMKQAMVQQKAKQFKNYVNETQKRQESQMHLQ